MWSCWLGNCGNVHLPKYFISKTLRRVAMKIGHWAIPTDCIKNSASFQGSKYWRITNCNHLPGGFWKTSGQKTELSNHFTWPIKVTQWTPDMESKHEEETYSWPIPTHWIYNSHQPTSKWSPRLVQSLCTNIMVRNGAYEMTIPMLTNQHGNEEYKLSIRGEKNEPMNCNSPLSCRLQIAQG